MEMSPASFWLNLKLYSNRIFEALGRLKGPIVGLFILFVISNLFTPFIFKNSFIWQSIFNEFLGGLALFLVGLDYMSHYLEKCAGDSMKAILARLTKSPLMGLLTGVLVTATIQSSSATTVMLISFVQAQIMTFGQTLGVILGADIGTTITAHMVAFKLHNLAFTFVAIGFVLAYAFKKTSIGYLGNAILGFGVLFVGMKVMSGAMEPVKDSAFIEQFMHVLEIPYKGWLLGIIIGTLFTALVQSSSATTGVIVAMAGSGAITMAAAVPVILGANIGTCITAGLACIKYSRDAKRAALAHVLFKLIGVALIFFFIPYYIDCVNYLTGVFGMGIQRQIATAHTVFNVGMALLFLPLIKGFAGMVYKIMPLKPNETPCGREVCMINTKLDKTFIESSMYRTAIEVTRKRVVEMFDHLIRMHEAIIIPFISDEKFIRKDPALDEDEKTAFIEAIPRQDKQFPEMSLVDGLHEREQAIDDSDKDVQDYLQILITQQLSPAMTKKVVSLLSVTEQIEAMGDIIHRILLNKLLIEKKYNLEHDFSLEGKEELMIFHSKVNKQLRRVRRALDDLDIQGARKVFEEKKVEYKELVKNLSDLHIERLRQDRKESRETHELHRDLFDQLKQLNYHAMQAAKAIYSNWSETEEEK